MEKVIKGGSLENTVDEIAKEIIKRDKSVSDESIAAVGALQEEVSSVKSAKANISLFEPLILTMDDLTVSGYISASSGNVSPTQNAICSPRIAIGDYTSLTVESSLGSAGYVIAFYDENLNILHSLSVLGQGTGNTKIYKVEFTEEYSSAVYVRLSCYGTSFFNSFSATFGAKYVDDLNNKMDYDSSEVLMPTFQTSGYRRISDGTVESSIYGRYTDKIPVDGYRRIIYNGRISTNGLLVALYDIHTAYIQGISIPGQGTGAYVSGIIDLSDDAYLNVGYVAFSEWEADRNYSNNYFSLDKGINFEYEVNKYAPPIISKELEKKETYLNLLKGVKINAFGDSITSTDYITPTWWQKIATRTGATFNNYGLSDTPIAQKSGIDNAFTDRVTALDTSADGVIMMGGTNDTTTPIGTWDSTDKTTFYGALNYIFTTLLNNFQGKPILICTPIQPKADYPNNVPNAHELLLQLQATDTASVEVRAEAIKAKCHQYGLPCLDLFSCSGISGVNSAYYTDSLHPSAYGQTRLASLIQSELSKLFIS